MDTRTPAAPRRKSQKRGKPRAVKPSTLPGAARIEELESILKDIDAGFRRRGMTAQDRRNLRKWIVAIFASGSPMAKGRVVIDTNVFLSAPISRQGVAARAVKFAEWIDADERIRLMAFVLREAMLIEPVPLRRYLADRDDDIFASLAIAARARVIVTGDKAFLVAQHVEGKSIVTPRRFLDSYAAA